MVFAETFTMDYMDAMDKGLDGTYQSDVPGFSHVWEVDSVSNSKGMIVTVNAGRLSTTSVPFRSKM